MKFLSTAIVRKASKMVLAGGAAGIAFSWPAMADAWWVRKSGQDCNIVVGGGTTTWTCPIPDRSDTPKTAIVTANVEAYVPGAGNNCARPCYLDWNGSGGSCDNLSCTGATGHITITLGGGNGFWDTDGGNDFGYVVFSSTAAGPRLNGVYYTN
jgi:hypothetical protein